MQRLKQVLLYSGLVIFSALVVVGLVIAFPHMITAFEQVFGKNDLSDMRDVTNGGSFEGTINEEETERLPVTWLSASGKNLPSVDFPEPLAELVIASFDQDEVTFLAKDDMGKVRTPEEVRSYLELKSRLLGVVTAGPYAGARIMMGEWGEEWGIGVTNYRFYYLVDDNGRLTLIQNYQTVVGIWASVTEDFSASAPKEALEAFEKAHARTSALRIPELEMPAALQDAQGRTYSYARLSGVASEKARISTHEMTVPGSTQAYLLSFSGESTFWFERPDGQYVHYTYDIAFAGNETAQIVWSDGSTAPVAPYKTIYAYGCGYTTPDVIPEQELGQINRVGDVRMSNGTTYEIFQPVWTQKDVERKDSSDESLTAPQSFYQNYLARLAWDTSTSSLTPSFEHFMQTRPVFYWKDPFGRWLRFTHESAQSAAECGKPVIYLYPESVQDIDVTVEPKGGFSFTEPVYQNGWRVTAHPDGMLVNRDDGKTYPYLFWEGRGYAYASPESYWVVAKKDVPTFLTKTLKTLGLNAKETADFEEFWLPKMQSAPYYQIGFHGTRVMDVLAPLGLSVKPDTRLRILMDYTELQEPAASNPPILLPPPARNGFTVIEWGGVLR